ncbi:sulfotransferase family protein [Cohaesibacter haloalkalitolerans]|uniref:sulfotransferase family protein n=1 Tax=Cohaesibacter haloalkalitolerans TaxID=1162980 RepID=UPI000E64724A|nr:sulfotransferase [Cohaesibacter haloalkalitolerans]
MESETKTHQQSSPAVRIPSEQYNSDPQISSLLFICGLHRSGTTLLERLLVSCFEISCLRAAVPESEGQHMQDVYSPAVNFGGPGKFAFSQAMQDELKSIDDYEACRSRIMHGWNKYIVGNYPTLIEKSPPNLTKIWWLRHVFPGSKFVILSRDPRAVSAATQKWSGTSLPELMAHWNSAYSQALENFDEKDCIIVRYEDLTNDYIGALNKIGNFFSLSKRQSTETIETRFSQIANSNDKYIKQHDGILYGHGIWEKFGYSV